MQKNWYIIYTKPGCEKKVVSSLVKKRIENFFPVITSKNGKSLRKRKVHSTPLFNSYVFVNMDDSETHKIQMIDGAMGLVFWKGKPAVVKIAEIEAIKEFASDYQNVKLEKTLVDPDQPIKIIEGPKYTMEGNLLSIKTSAIKLNLPSIGYTMTAEVGDKNVLRREIAFWEKESLLQS